MFRQQLRAILRASAHGKVRLLVPMLAHLSEVRLVQRSARARQTATLGRHRPFADIEVGAMIEVPAAALIVPTFLQTSTSCRWAPTT